MFDVARILAKLQSERNRAEKELRHFDEAIAAIGRLVTNNVGAGRQMKPRAGRTLSTAARRKIARAQKARWAKLRQGKAAKG